MPSLSHHTESRDKPCRPSEAKGTPLSVRICFGSPYWRTEVGEFENSVGPYGTFDQGGNVWEWNEAILDDGSRGLRGGGYSYDSDRLRASYRHDFSVPPIEGVYGFGFRIAGVPEPGSITLLVCGALAGLLWWCRRGG